MDGKIILVYITDVYPLMWEVAISYFQHKYSTMQYGRTYKISAHIHTLPIVMALHLDAQQFSYKEVRKKLEQCNIFI